MDNVDSYRHCTPETIVDLRKGQAFFRNLALIIAVAFPTGSCMLLTSLGYDACLGIGVSACVFLLSAYAAYNCQKGLKPMDEALAARGLKPNGTAIQS